MVNIRIQRPRRRRVFTALKDCEPPPTCMTDSFVLDHLGGVVREHREHLRKLSQGSIGHQNQGMTVDAASPIRLQIPLRPASCLQSGLHFELPSSALGRSEENTSELQSLMRISYAVFCLKNTTINNNKQHLS